MTLRTTSMHGGVVLVLVLAVSAQARGSDVRTDGVYGRLGGDAVLSVEAGGGVGVVNGDPRPALDVALRARALDMAGFFLSYDNAVGATRWDALALGVDLRPLLLARVFQDWEHGPRFWDLLVDSIGIELGGALVNPGDSFRAGSGFAFVLGGGAEVPLAWSQGSGLTLRVGVRWIHASDLDAGAAQPARDGCVVSLSLVGRGMTRLGLLGVP